MYLKSILTRGLKRLWSGAPATLIAEPFDRAQATRVLNAVLDRGTFEEINAVFLALGRRGYTASPSSDTLYCWQLVPIQPLHIEGQTHVTGEKATLSDIRELAGELEFDVRDAEQDGMFAMYKRSDRSIGGIWSNNQAGIQGAYNYLVRYRRTLEQSDQARGRF
ncbi:MAG: hypothetical protein ACREDR_42580 [Blastocatellia bacterium]